MAERKYLEFTVLLPDKDLVYQLQGTTFSGSNQAVGRRIMAPDAAAAEYGAPITVKYTGPAPSPSIISDYFDTSDHFPTNVSTFQRSAGSWWGWVSALLFGLWGSPEPTTFYWQARFAYQAAGGVSEVPTEPAPAALAERRWCDGFELPEGGEAGSGNAANYVSVAASRHMGGLGMAVRNDDRQKSHVNTDNKAGDTTPTSMWERFYIRVRKYPQVAARLWGFRGTPQTGYGIDLQLSPTGSILVLNPSSVLGTVAGDPLAIDTWTKIDVLWKYGTADGYCKIYVNGVQRFSMLSTAMPAGSGTNVANTWTNSKIGGATAGHLGSWDFDDWIGAFPPTGGSVDADTLAGQDWLHGSAVMLVEPIGFAASNGGGFAGPGGADALDWRHLRYRVPGTGTYGHYLASSAASERLAVVMNVAKPQAIRGGMGIAAMMVGLYGSRTAGSATDAVLAYKRTGEAEVTKTLTGELTTLSWSFIRYAPSGLLAPEALADGLEVAYTANSTAASTKVVHALMAAVEVIGDFHPEDHTPVSTDAADAVFGFPHFAGEVHNAPYRDSVYGHAGPPPMGPVLIHTGTYVGNGKSKELAFRAPVHWLWIRNTSSQAGTQWWASGVGSRQTLQDIIQPELCSQVMIDQFYAPTPGEDNQSMQTLVRISGNHAAANANGTTYQYIAVGDAAMRFLEVGAFRETHQGAQSHQMASTWVPELVQVQREQIGSAGSSQFYQRGLGGAANEIFSGVAAKLTAAFDIGAAGLLTIPAGSGLYNTANSSILYAAFRRDDGSADPGAKYVLQLATYTGDGTASRTISLAPVTGRRPMWVLVVGSNGASRYRDPSHTGTTSTTLPATADASTGITAGGIDSISVGSALNANGVVYDVLVFPGCDATAGNNGWGISCEHLPVSPDDASTGRGAWEAEPDAPTEVDDGGGEPGTGEPGGPVDPGPNPGYSTYDFSEMCYAPSTFIINLALARLGISKQVVDIRTEVSAEAVAGRLNFSLDVSHVLRDFPWGFATRYEKLLQIFGDGSEQTASRVQTWSAAVTYAIDEVVNNGGTLYYALQGNNLNHVPGVAPTWWTTTPPEEVNGDWRYGYRAPQRCLFSRRLVNNATKTRRDWDPDPPKFRLGTDDRGFIIWTNEVNPELEYTQRPLCPAGIDDPLFQSALAWKHAATIGPALARDPKLVAGCLGMYGATLELARRAAAAEQQQAPAGDASWITERN